MRTSSWSSSVSLDLNIDAQAALKRLRAAVKPTDEPVRSGWPSLVTVDRVMVSGNVSGRDFFLSCNQSEEEAAGGSIFVGPIALGDRTLQLNAGFMGTVADAPGGCRISGSFRPGITSVLFCVMVLDLVGFQLLRADHWPQWVFIGVQFPLAALAYGLGGVIEARSARGVRTLAFLRSIFAHALV